MKRFLDRHVFSSEKSISLFSMASLTFLIVSLLTPVIGRNIPRAILLLAMAGFGCSVAKRVVLLTKREKITLSFLALYMVIIAAYRVLGVSSAALYYYFNIVQFFFFLGAIILIHKSLFKNQVVFLLVVSIGTILVNLVSNVYLFFKHGSRTYIKLFNTTPLSNAINTQYSTAIMLLSCMLFVWACYQRKLYFRLIGYSISACIFLFIVCISQRMITLVFTVLLYFLLACYGLFTLLNKRLSRKQMTIVVLILVVVIAVCFIFSIPILGFIRSCLPSDRLVQRINQIIRFLKTGDITLAGGSLSKRYELIMTSWNTFTASYGNFLLGVGDHRVTNELIGNHSLFFDELARYGVLFAPVMYVLLYRSIKTVIGLAHSKSDSAKNDWPLYIIMLIFVLRAFIGAVFDSSIGIVIFIIIPLLYMSLDRDNHTLRSR